MNITLLPDESAPENKLFGHRCYSLSTTGIIVYDPVRPKQQNAPFWCVAEIDKDITAYYRQQFLKRFGVELYAPAFDAHVSIMKGYQNDKILSEWKYKDQTDVIIQFDHRMWWNDKHVWLNTYFPEFFEIRQFYEIKNENRGHLTIGKFKP